MEQQGKITRWNDDKGFGFITPDNGGQQVFVHINGFAARQHRPGGGEQVSYRLRTDRQGRAQAVAVSFVDKRLKVASRGRNPFPLVFVSGFVALLGAVVVTQRLPGIVVVLYALASLVTLIVYARDKSAAKKNQWRTPESTLHLLALFAGWPGALLAQRLLRHKSSKQSFQLVFWLTVVVNCAALGWLLTADGSSMLNSLLSMLPSQLTRLLQDWGLAGAKPVLIWR